MADRGDTHYHVPSLNTWFLVSSVLFLATMIWTVIDDWNAEWKQYQRDFRHYELEMAEGAFQALEESGAVAEKERLAYAVYEAQLAVAAKGGELAEAERKAYELDEQLFKIGEEFKKAKSVLNWEIFGGEQEILDVDVEITPEKVESGELKKYRDDVAERELEFQEASASYEAQKTVVDALKAEAGVAEAALFAGTRDLTVVQEQIESLAPSDFATQAANFVRDFPGLDFIGPNLKVQKYVLHGITFDLNFTKKPRIDMCTTCHMGSDREEFEGAPQPSTAHPRLGLFLSSKSPHPVNVIGCTACHRGAGEALSFQHTDHRPSDDVEASLWHEEYHWHKQHHWDYPMLREQNVEAGCVQCHQTSMELIADEAPNLSKGYRLFEEKGCYACHKVEWFPTSRRPGPSLKNLAAKLAPEFVNSWIADPAAFRPTTDMPQIFHLENWAPDEVVTVSNYGQGEPITGQQWNENAVAAITAYLYQLHPVQPLAPVPAQAKASANAERGREVMNLSGCFACHNTAPHQGREDDVLPALSNRVTDQNVMGPNLRGVTAKLNETWLYHWIKDPTSYWPDTRMPNLRLSDQDAMDITAYMLEDPDGIFTDTPGYWSGVQDHTSMLDKGVLREQARWYFQKEGRNALEARLNGDWDEIDVLAGKVGQALITNYGCFSCHEISGMESMMPIGAELTKWGSKTVDKLDYGLHYLKEVAGMPELDHHYREGWLERKLLRPRSYDLDKIKTPKDRLRMPYFAFSQDEAEAITTFVLGLVNDDVELAKMVPSAEQVASDTGMRAVRQNNCMSCHVIDHPQVTFKDEDGNLASVRGVIQPLGDDTFSPSMDSMQALEADRVAAEEYADEEIEEIGIKLLEVEPDFGAPGDLVYFDLANLVDVKPSRGGDFVRNVTQYYLEGTVVADPESPNPRDPEFKAWTYGGEDALGALQVQDVDGVVRSYSNEAFDKVRWTFAPPILVNEGHKLQPEWFYGFLKEPIPLRKQVRVKMPTFQYDAGEAEAIVAYFGNKARYDWHSRYAKTLRLALGRTVNPALTGELPNGWQLPQEAMTWPIMAHENVTEEGDGCSLQEMSERMSQDPKNQLDADIIASIEAGYKADVEANFGKLHRWGTSQGFHMAGPIKEGLEVIERRTPEYLERRYPYLEVGQTVGVEGVNCYQCHPNSDMPEGERYVETPIAWAPPLENVRTRLRDDWVHDWMWKPDAIYVGTAMAPNFITDIPAYQKQYPESSNAQQIQAVMDWVYNMDRRDMDVLAESIIQKDAKIRELEAQIQR